MQDRPWICTNCYHFRSRAVVEALPNEFFDSLAGEWNTWEARQEYELRACAATATWVCEHCAATGSFVPEDSPTGGGIMNDLIYETIAAKLQEAGYPVDAFSAECDLGDHAHCAGRNRFQSGTFLDRCQCSCHG